MGSLLDLTLKHMFEIERKAAKRIDAGAESFNASFGLTAFESVPRRGRE